MSEHEHMNHAHADHTGHEEHTGHDMHAGHDMSSHDGHDMSGTSGLAAMARSASLHCLSGCAIGEILGLVLGTAWGLHNAASIALAVVLAFFFGYTISTFPLLRAGLALTTALGVVLAADTVSILVMEIVDNLVMAVIPGAMDAGLPDATFWISMMASLLVAYFAAYPVNLRLLARGKGHALTHEFHDAPAPTGARRFIPDVAAGTLAAVIIAFMLGALLVSTQVG